MKRPIETSLILDPLLGYPHKNYPTIHVSGTNGKGSTSNMIASILMEAGYKVGTFNTPCIFNEMDITKVNGIPIPRDKYKILHDRIKDVRRDNNITNMFISTIRVELSFLYFQECNVDIAVIEADLGAANDSTAVITPIVSLLTNITKDHLKLFNNDFIEYAKEKAGIIKNNVPIYVGETPDNDEIKNILLTKANECNSTLTYTDTQENNLILEYYGDGNYNTIFGKVSMSLGGDYQKDNLNLALNAIIELRKQGYNISDENIISGLEHICENTKLYGRWQYLSKSPRIILDCGHNVGAWTKIVSQISHMRYNKLHIIMQICADKEVDIITKMLPDDKQISYWFPNPHAKRLINSEELIEKTNWMVNSERSEHFSMTYILNKLIHEAEENDVILVCGTCKNIRMTLDCVRNTI